MKLLISSVSSPSYRQKTSRTPRSLSNVLIRELSTYSRL